MANRFWVGGSATWDGTAGSKWATTSGGAGGAAVPTNTDDVFLDAASGAVTVTTLASGSVTCQSLNCAGFTGTLVGAASGTLSIGGAIAGASNIALSLVAGMTFTGSAGFLFSFQTTSAVAAVQTVDFAGKNLGSAAIIFGPSSAGGSFKLLSGYTISASSTTRLDSGTLDTNGQTFSTGFLKSNNAVTRTLTLGASAITVTGVGTAVDFTVTTGLTLNAGTSLITCTGVAARFVGGAKTWNDLTMSGSAPGINNSGSDPATTFHNVVMSGSGIASIFGTSPGLTFNNFTRTGTAAKTDQLTVGANATHTVNGVLTLTGNSTINRLLIISSGLGGSRTLALGASGTTSMTNVDYQDFVLTGTGAPFSGTSLGDLGGNSGITFPASTTQTWQGTLGGSWSDVTKWTSRIPLPQDDVAVASAFSASQTITGDMPRLGRSISFVGATGNPTFQYSVSVLINGSLTLISGMTFATFSANATTFCGRGSYTLTNAGKAFTASVSFSAPGGTYTLQDDYGPSGNFLTFAAGTFNANGKNVNALRLSCGGATGRTVTVNCGSGTWTLSGPDSATPTPCWTVAATFTTWNQQTSTVVFSDTSSTLKTVQHITQTFYNVTFTGGSAGYSFAGGGFTVTNTLTATGAAGSPVIVRSLTSPSQQSITLPNGRQFVNFVDFKDTAAVTNPIYDSNGTDSTNNTNILFGGGFAFDAVTVSDATGVAAFLSRVVADVVSVSDAAASLAAAYIRASADSVALSDTATRTQAARARSASDAASVSDLAARIASLARSASDAASVSDAASRTSPRSRSAADSVTAADAAVRSMTATRAAADAVSRSDIANRVVARLRSANDSVAAPIDAAIGTHSLRVTATDLIAGLVDGATATTTGRLIPGLLYAIAANRPSAIAAEGGRG